MMSYKKLFGAAIAGALAFTGFSPSLAEASPGACVAIYQVTGDGCSFRQTGSKTLKYNFVLEPGQLSEPVWEVGMCIVATWDCVTKYSGSDSPQGTVTNAACLTQECSAYVRVSWIDQVAYIYTV